MISTHTPGNCEPSQLTLDTIIGPRPILIHIAALQIRKLQPQICILRKPSHSLV